MNSGPPSDAAHALFHASNDAVVGIGADGLIDAWNPAAERIFGWSSSEVLGFPPPLPDLPSGQAGKWELTIETRSGEPIEIEASVSFRESGGLLIVATDRSQVLRTERANSERLRGESRFRELLDAAPDAIIEVDRSGAIVLVNQAAESLFGYSREELLSMNVDALVPEALRGGHAHNRASFWKTPGTRPMGRGLVLSARRNDGSSIPVEISLSPVKTEDGFRVTAIIRDVTERRIAEEKIRAANQELEIRNREIQRADRLKSEFLASMSHELRTPLHTIIGFTELLAEELEGPLNDKQKRFVEHVRKDSVHLLELINDVLDLSKIEAGRMDLDIHPVDATEILGDTLGGIGHAANAKNINVENRLTVPYAVQADRVRLREIFTNLLSNAIKFTPAGGTVRIDARVEGRSRVRFSVTDSGIGIAPEDQSVIFDKFRQIGSTTRGVREGTGLGLAIVKHLVEMHGGRVELESAPGKGSCFSFTVPLDAGREGSAPLVLIIEDEPAACELLASYLNPLGVSTEVALSATGAAAYAKELRPDAVTLDLLMPGRSGWRVLAELRAAPETASTPVFVMSVLDRDNEALSLGATEYLQKPVKKDTLVRALIKHVPAVKAALAK
jgi:PAS domain S-box-containing protein